MNLTPVLVKDINPGNDGSYPIELTKVDNSVFFRAGNASRGGLWQSDGTAIGTVLVKDINLGSSFVRPVFTVVNGILFFTIDDDINGRELWTLVSTTATIDPETGSISNKVWFDTNGNGLFDAGEKGVAKLPVVLTEAGTDGVFGTKDDSIQTKKTDRSGNYRFRNLSGGTYQVSIERLPVGFGFTAANVGQNEALDSDVDPVTGTTDPIVLPPGGVNPNVQMG